MTRTPSTASIAALDCDARLESECRDLVSYTSRKKNTLILTQPGAAVLIAAALPSFARSLSERFAGSVRVVISRDSA